MEPHKKNIVIALMVAMFLGAVEGTVVTTATPTIVKDLHGFESISLVFSVYLLTTAISTPIYGKLSDLYGRVNILCIGIIIFLLGSVLCGVSQNMPMLIAFRALQGLGAGSIFTVTFTIVGDVFTLEEKSKVQGGMNTVWGVASLAGPFLGGFLIDTLSWHWIFFINLPFGILSIILLKKSLKENIKKEKHKIDYAGAVVLSAAMVLLLNIFLSNNTSVMRQIYFISLSTVVVCLLFIIFYYIERKAAEPIIPFDLFTGTNILVNSISFLSSAALIGINVYMPIFIQNILGYNPTVSGLALAPMSVAWLISSFILGKCIAIYGGKLIIIISNLILVISTALLIIININSSLIFIILCLCIMGFGMGGAFTTLTIIIQSSVNYQKRGAAVATNSLLRTIGQTIGVGLFGSLFNVFIARYFNQMGINGINSKNLYTAAASGFSVTNEQIKLSLNSSIHVIVLLLTLLTIICFLLSFVLPRKIKVD